MTLRASNTSHGATWVRTWDPTMRSYRHSASSTRVGNRFFCSTSGTI